VLGSGIQKRPHKQRRAVTDQDPRVYMNNFEMAKLAATDEAEFLRLMREN
jgi:hypothetical protein